MASMYRTKHQDDDAEIDKFSTFGVDQRNFEVTFVDGHGHSKTKIIKR